jgi:S1-C subfamily serine protease
MEEPGAGVQEPVASGPGLGSPADGPARTDAPPASSPWEQPRAPATSVVPVWRPVVASPEAVPTPEPGSAGHRPGGWPWVVVATAAALVGAVVGGGIVAVTQHHGGGTQVNEISAGPALLNGTTNIEAVIAKVLPAIVSIDAQSPGSAGGTVQDEQGTGMIVSSNGDVVTNNHLISGATSIAVTLYGKTKSIPARLVDTDPGSDVALLQITGVSDLPTVAYGNSDNVQVGDAVVAIGNALGLSAGSPTVTQGIISATGRSVQASDVSGRATETLTNLFQTDAAINPGNSGGPLVDSSGKVIGMNTAVASSADGASVAQNIGFAIPSNKITQLLPALRRQSISANGQTGSGYLGVDVVTLTGQLRREYNFVPAEGAVVAQVVPGSPADVAGLEEGDVITSLDGKAITSADQLAVVIQADKPGQSIRIGLDRGQEQLTLTSTLASSQPPGG